MQIDLRILLILFVLFTFGFTHSTYYPEIDKKDCDSSKTVKIFSWHIHLLFWSNHEKHKQGAFEVRKNFIETFNFDQGPYCIDLFHQNYTCLFNPNEQPVGPFVTGQWAIFLTNEDFQKYVFWFVQNRNGYDVLVHPNSGCEKLDHSDWALWSGQPWQIDFSVFTHDEPWEQKYKQQNHTTIVLRNQDGDNKLIKSFLEKNDI